MILKLLLNTQMILIVFNDMMADMLNNKKLNLIVTELFIRGRKLNISLAFTLQSYFALPKNIKLKLYASFYHEHSKQTIASRNCV